MELAEDRSHRGGGIAGDRSHRPVAPATLTLALLGLAATSGEARADPEPPPRFDVEAKQARLDGTGSSPVWTRVELEIHASNRLSVPASHPRVELSLLSSHGADPKPIPGWTFSEVELPLQLEPNSTESLAHDRALPPLRRPPPAQEVLYRVRLRSYLVDRPSLGLTFSLLGSPHPSDQRAALRSLERSEHKAPEEATSQLAAEVSKTLRYRPARPTATDALRMLLAIRTVGTLRLSREVRVLLRLPDSVDSDAWGKAVLELASRMVAVSQPEDPRLQVLPRWGRQVATLLQVTAKDALEETTREAILQVGEEAVPALILAGEVPSLSRRARRLLEQLGRATPELQLRAGSRTTQLATIRAFTTLRSAEAVPALVRLLTQPGPLADAARSAILAIGEPAVLPVAELVGESNTAPIEQLLVALGRKHRRALRELARLYGVPSNQAPKRIVAQVAERRAFERTVRIETDIEDAIRLGGQGAFQAALRALDEAKRESPSSYQRFADPIARLYLARGEQLLEQGDFTASIDILQEGRRIRALPEIDHRLTDAQVKLAHGYTSLGWSEEAETALNAAPIQRRNDVSEARAKLFAQRARTALGKGQVGLAQNAVRQALAASPDDPELGPLRRQVFIYRHLIELSVVAVGAAGMLLAVFISWQKQEEQKRLTRMAKRL